MNRRTFLRMLVVVPVAAVMAKVMLPKESDDAVLMQMLRRYTAEVVRIRTNEARRLILLGLNPAFMPHVREQNVPS